jgi:GntR family transcriptional regulator, N-acetylglucosamine utilization regulator
MPDPGTRYRTVSRSSRLPLYHQVELDMRRRVEDGQWRAGDRIPSESELCDHYGASRITIRRAISELVADGLLVRYPGRGTFVREPTFTAGPRGLTSFTQEMASLGLRASAKVMDVRRRPVPADVADRLGLSPGEDVVVLTRLRTGDGKPMGVQTAYLPAELVPGMELAELGDGSLYTFLAEMYGVQPAEAEEVFEVGPIRGADAQLLDVRSGTCGFHVERLTLDADGQPIEYVRSVIRGDRYRIRMSLNANRS